MGRYCLLVLLLSFSVSAAMENTRKVPCRALAAMKDEKPQWCTACQRHPKPKKACTRSTATAPAVSSLSEGRSILPGKRKASGANYTGEVIDHTHTRLTITPAEPSRKTSSHRPFMPRPARRNAPPCRPFWPAPPHSRLKKMAFVGHSILSLRLAC